ncbi:hypothetical protein BH11VER1_BH11VER1_29280 [soil metagenome]
MNTKLPSNATDLPVYGEEPDTYYSLEVFAELAGVDTTTILHYQEQGIIRPVLEATGDDAAFDAESLRQLRRIEHLRATCEMNEAGLKLLLSLLEEVEQLRQERRQLLR